MQEFTYSKHSINMIIEREIKEQWIIDTLDFPDRTEFIDNNELHYIKRIEEFGNRFLRIVINPYTIPKTIVTLFFDRRIKE